MKQFTLSTAFALLAIFLTTAAATAQNIAADTTASSVLASDTVSPAVEAEIDRIVAKRIAEQTISNQNDDTNKTAIATIAIITPFAAIVAGLVVAFAAGTKRRRMKYSLVEKAIEAGYQIPEYVFNEKSTKIQGQSKKTLRSSVTLIAVGTGLVLFFVINGDYEVAGLMSLILLLGIGKLAIALLEIRDENNLQEKQLKESNATEENA